jgi:hypothetical protein
MFSCVAEDYTHVFAKVPPSVDLAQEDLLHEKILQCHLVKKANSTFVQILVKRLRLANKLVTWEDYNVLKAPFPWGQAATQGGGHCYTCYRHVDNRGSINLTFTCPQVRRIKVTKQQGKKSEANIWRQLSAA